MKWRDHHYDVVLRQEIAPGRLARATPAELADAEETGHLAGNSAYQDLSVLGVADLADTLEIERKIMRELMAAEDLEAAADAFESDRFGPNSPEDKLFGLDVGVASAVVAVSALGAIPVASCNAGGFGGLHQARQPYVAAFVPRRHAARLTALAVASAVGVMVGDDGLVRIYGRSDFDLMRFAETALGDLVA